MVDLSLVKYQVEKLSAIMSCPTAMMNSDVYREESSCHDQIGHVNDDDDEETEEDTKAYYPKQAENEKYECELGILRVVEFSVRVVVGHPIVGGVTARVGLGVSYACTDGQHNST